MESYLRQSSSHEYLLRSLENETEQQQRLEQILEPLNLSPQKIAYFACGAGLSYYLIRKYRGGNFSLMDLTGIASGQGDLPMPSDEFDLVFSVQPPWNNHEHYRRELMRICKPGGRIFIVSGEILELHKLRQS